MRSFIQRMMKDNDIARKRLFHLISIVAFYIGGTWFLRWLDAASFYASHFWYTLFNAIVLVICISYLNSDFEIRIAKPDRKFVRTVLLALLYAALFAAVSSVFYSFFYQVDIAFKRPPDTTVSFLAVYLIAQITIAFSEEAFFRFYLYEQINAHINHAAVSGVLVAILFSLGHQIVPLVMHIVFAFFSLYASFLRRRHKNSFYLCSLVHFFYNCILQFAVTLS